MEMLLTGDMISAEEANRIGLVNRVVAPGAEREAALKLAHQIASKSAAVVKLGKQAFYAQLEMNLADAYRHASEVMVDNMLMHDAAEGVGAFLDKRAPEWEDR
jgi:enoyl-CoA hydratase/carnithine racemase